MNEDKIRPYSFDRRSAEEARESGRKGGIASGKTRRRNANFKRLAKLFLAAEPPEKSQAILRNMGFDDDDISNAMAIIYALGSKAMKGDVNAAKALHDWAGQSSEDKRRDEEVKIRREELELKKAQAEQKIADTSEVEDLGYLAELLNDSEDSAD